jgi:hypothetical protein
MNPAFLKSTLCLPAEKVLLQAGAMHYVPCPIVYF